MIRWRWLLFSLVFFITASSYGGTTGKISGRILDAQTKEPLVGVGVIVEGTGRGAATDLDGYYFILNVSPGTYSVTAQYLGYHSTTQSSVLVRSDITSKVDFILTSSSIQLEAVEIVASRPTITKDLTSSEQGFGGAEIEAAPVESLDEIISLQAGINALGSEESGFVNGAPGDGMHIRGGRENETLFIVDGVKVGDDIYGGSRYVQNTSGSSISEMKTIIGTFNAEYDRKTAGIISVVTMYGDEEYKLSIGGYTDNFGVDDFNKDGYQGDVTLSGPVPAIKHLTFFVNGQVKTTDGRRDLVGYEIDNWQESAGQVGRSGGEEVPLAWKDEWNGMAKLTYTPTGSIKISANYFQSEMDKGKYKHDYRYIPYAQSWSTLSNTGMILKMVHTVSPATMYEIIGSFQTTDFFFGVDEDVAMRQVYGQRMTHEDYYYSGASNDWNVDSSWTWQASGSVTSQINRKHLLKSGVEMRWLDVLHRMDPASSSGIMEIEDEVYPVYFAYTERKPREFSAYVQDKMEFDEIGMIMNLGFRMEHFNPNMYYMENPDDPYNTKMSDTDNKTRISPRFGISYPVSDKAAFHLAYGHFYQMPRYMELLSGYNDEGYLAGRPNLGAYPGISNPNANPEKTISYETGVQFELIPGVTANVTGYYREMSELMGVRWMNGGGGYVYLDNTDFGNSKGVEMYLEKNLSDMWSGRINYTWSTANISTSSPMTSIQKNKFVGYKTYLADWDRPHEFSAILLVSNPSSWAASAVFNARSGRPYSVLAEELNTERMPMETKLDMKFSKFVHYASMKGTIYLKMGNVFDKKNILSVYPLTGEWDDDGESGTTPDHDAVPSRRSEGRTAVLGFKLNF